MDTIQISIILSEEKLNEVSHVDLQDLAKYINEIKSDYGYRYCDCLEISNTGNIIIKISYPRFFEGINAYLISNSKECTRVQFHFCFSIHKHPLMHDAEIELSRVDIPFTFMMGEDYNFNSYRKVYQVLDYVYRKKNTKSNPKAYANVSKYTPETIIYADTATIAKYNQKIMIYDQFNNLKSKTDDESRFFEITSEYKGLSKRMRIEVSKRINRKRFSFQEFAEFDIFKEYSKKFKNYLLENLFDINEVDLFYEKSAIDLAKSLLDYRNQVNNFIYEAFIYKEIEQIYDYEIIRRALKICIDNLKTREKAVTAIRRVLRAYQQDENIIVMDTYETIKQMRKFVVDKFI